MTGFHALLLNPPAQALEISREPDSVLDATQNCKLAVHCVLYVHPGPGQLGSRVTDCTLQTPLVMRSPGKQ